MASILGLASLACGVDLVNSHGHTETPTILTKLSVELLLLVVHHLDLHDQFLLSHTCRSFRAVTLRHWHYTWCEMEGPDKLALWERLAYVSLTHWACSRCWLHRVRLDDTPSARFQLPPPPSRSNPDAFRFEFERKRCMLEDDPWTDRHRRYLVRQYHVQLALKYNRKATVDDLQVLHFNKLMATFRDFRILSDESGLSLRYEAKPQITNDTFLLYEEWSISYCKPESQRPTPGWPDMTEDIRSVMGHRAFDLKPCRHLLLPKEWENPSFPVFWRAQDGRKAGVRTISLLGIVADALSAAPGTTAASFSCLLCKTDCEVLDSKRRPSGFPRIVIRTRSDFGSDESLQSSAWASRRRSCPPRYFL